MSSDLISRIKSVHTDVNSLAMIKHKINNHANRILTERSQIIYTGLAQNGEHPHILVIHQGTGQNIHKS